MESSERLQAAAFAERQRASEIEELCKHVDMQRERILSAIVTIERAADGIFGAVPQAVSKDPPSVSGSCLASRIRSFDRVVDELQSTADRLA